MILKLNCENRWGEVKTSGVVISSLKKLEVPKYVSKFSIKYLIEGEECYNSNGRNLNLKSNQYTIINEGSDVSIGFKGKDTSIGVCLYPSESIMHEYNMLSSAERIENLMDPNFLYGNTEFLEKVYFSMDSDFGIYLKQFCLKIYAEQDDSSNHRKVNFDQLFYFLLYKNNESIQKKIERLDKLKKSTKEELYIRLEIGKSILEDSYNTDISIDFLAEQCMLSKFYLIRSFKKIYGCTPYSYLLKVRLAKAFKLYQLGAHSIAEIAEIVNYSHPRNLLRDLKKNYLSSSRIK